MESKQETVQEPNWTELLAKALRSLKGAPLTADTKEWRELVSAPERFGKKYKNAQAYPAQVPEVDERS